MAAHVVAQGSSDRLWSLIKILKQLFRRKFRELGLISKQLVRVVHVGLVMLVMVNLHGEGVDVWLQCCVIGYGSGGRL